MRTLIISNNSKKIGALEMLVSKVSDSITIWHYDGIKLEEAENFDLIVLSGGSGLAVDRNIEKLTPEMELVKNSRVPIIGVCLGFEIIAYTFGCELMYRTEAVRGIVEISPLQYESFFEDATAFKVYESHKYYIEKVPENLIALAESEFGLEIIKHKTKQIWAFQFHPEDRFELNDGEKLFLNLVNNIIPNRKL